MLPGLPEAPAVNCVRSSSWPLASSSSRHGPLAGGALGLGRRLESVMFMALRQEAGSLSQAGT